ncbi:hypothetical protein FN846DRAFT_900209 [Sphaerosporella brunnea]|uniref:SEC7 domain-containing protein n=1 Tax=Sphaerosporella brunnea TaxID=1250544 RepID=A0A5J5EN51_9PEZI|nr:hypothetical protein FN846DRAFT_900209 [Sphaerosporella brunnea]
MNPYIRPSARSSTLESTMEDREVGYTQRGATIRTVASSDPVSPRRPSFFGESPRGRDDALRLDAGGSGKKYQKETWSGDAEEQHTPSKSHDNFDRPQTSPNSPLNSRTFFLDKDEDDNWPPSPPSRGVLSNARGSVTGFLTSGKERQGSMSSSSGRKPSIASLSQARKASMVSLNGRKSSVASKEAPIVDMKEIERMYNDEDAKRGSTKERLGLDTANLEPPRPKEGSWIAGPSPSTPRVTLQKEGHGAEAEFLGHSSDEEAENRLDDNGFPEPSDEDNEKARKIFEGDEEFISKDRAAAWLGDGDPNRATALKAYMQLFDWSGCNILQSMRTFCERLIFKGETQQVDRIMVAFAHRWCECNPNHGFKSSDIVHTILYSLLLLNTDMHLADIPSSQKMTRGQFIKNTMATIRRGIQEAAAIAEELEFRQQQSNTMPCRSQTPHRRNAGDESPTFASASATFPLAAPEIKGYKARSSSEFGKEHKGSRLSRIGGSLSPRILPDDHAEKAEIDAGGGDALVNAPIGGGLRLWETQLEIVLKDFYQSVKTCALPLHGSSQENMDLHSNSLSVFSGAGGVLRRSPSTISKAASEMSSVGRGRTDNNKLGAKWTAKNRSRQRVYNGSFAGSSRTSLEERSVWSPSASSTWSKHTLDRTQTSMSVDSLGSSYSHAGDYQQSLGFANALSNAIIREEGASVASADVEVDPLDGDDTLELEGAPWAKEGLLKHKHHLESVDKRAKNRGWTECFAVIQRGYMRLFQFPSKSGKNLQFAGGVVGGGNWTENAEPIGSFLLRQTLASSLPPPGYSKSKPNVWALSLPSGAVHFFEVGTAEIVKEFVTTANYWSARLSKEPLIGGVSNVEYGWGDCLTDVDTSVNSPPPSIHNEAAPHSRSSLQMSIRSSIDHGTIRPRLPGDKIHIKDWVPPSQSMVASSLPEKEQLKALENYVANIEAELAKHNELRHPMQMAFTPRHPNGAKALANWEKKSSYLLREIIKFTTYIDTLNSAIQRREKNQPAPMIEADDLDITPRPNKGKELDLDGVLSSGF